MNHTVEADNKDPQIKRLQEEQNTLESNKRPRQSKYYSLSCLCTVAISGDVSLVTIGTERL